MTELCADLLISAQIRIAAKEGVPITVVRRGAESGAIMLKINLLDGTAKVLSRARVDDDQVWMPARGSGAMSEKDADLYIERQTNFDPDCWVLEIEDRQGRHWFPGKVMT